MYDGLGLNKAQAFELNNRSQGFELQVLGNLGGGGEHDFVEDFIAQIQAAFDHVLLEAHQRMNQAGAADLGFGDEGAAAAMADDAASETELLHCLPYDCTTHAVNLAKLLVARQLVSGNPGALFDLKLEGVPQLDVERDR